MTSAQADNGYTQLTPAQMATVEKSFDIFSEVADITFTKVNPGEGQINFHGTDDFNHGSVARTPKAGEGGTLASITGAEAYLGDPSFDLILHEIGHTVGLTHPQNYSSDYDYSENAESFNDSIAFTVMSYFYGEDSGADLAPPRMDGAVGLAPGPDGKTLLVDNTALSIVDIAALQRLYGANTDTFVGDTVYGFNSNTGDDSLWNLKSARQWIYGAIWDSGGVDTIDMSGYADDAQIDLRETAFSSTGGLKYNLSIARGVTIENAIGGDGDDAFRGNAADNSFIGNGGSDVVFYDAESASFTFAYDDQGRLLAMNGQDTDTLEGVEYLQFANQLVAVADIDEDGNLNVSSSSTDPEPPLPEMPEMEIDPTDMDVEREPQGESEDTTELNEFTSLVPVNNATKVPLAATGDETGKTPVVPGSQGNLADYSAEHAPSGMTINLTTLTAENKTAELSLMIDIGVTEVKGTGGDDTITGNGQNNILHGGSGNDTIHSGAGNNQLHGNLGDDTFHTGSGNDEVYGGDGNDTVFFTGNKADYWIYSDEYGYLVVEDLRADEMGTGRDILMDVETLQFTDSIVAASDYMMTM